MPDYAAIAAKYGGTVAPAATPVPSTDTGAPGGGVDYASIAAKYGGKISGGTTTPLPAGPLATTTPPAQPQQEGFFSRLIKDPINSLLVTPAARVAQAGVAAFGALTGNQNLANAGSQDVNVHLPVLGNFNVPAQKTGTAGVEQIAGQAGKAAGYLAENPIAGGALYGAGNAASQGGSVSDIAKGTVVGAGAGAVAQEAGALVSKAVKPVARALDSSAADSYSQALAPTTKANKFITSNVAPQLADRGVVAMTQKGLQSQAQSGMSTAGDALSEAYNALPEATRVKVDPVLNDLEGQKQQFVVNDTDPTTGKPTQVIANPKAYQALQGIQDTVKQFGGDISVGSLRNLRQVWDSTVAQSGGFYGKSLSEGSELSATKAGADAIRGELANQFPDIAKINHEFNFWSNVNKVISDTIDRGTGAKTPLGQKIAGAAGAAAGMVHGGPEGAAITGSVFKNLAGMFESTAWKTVSGATKASLADAIMSGDTDAIGKVAGRITTNAALGAGNK